VLRKKFTEIGFPRQGTLLIVLTLLTLDVKNLVIGCENN